MLGKTLNISILGTVRERYLYSGYPERFSEIHSPVYIVTNRELRGLVACTIICIVVSSGKKQTRLIASPTNEIFYEPEIKSRLTKTSVVYDKMFCLYEKSCGAVVYRRTTDGVKVLLVKNHNGRCWSFPKGHVEKDETEEETALREIKEETGLDVEIEKDFRETSIYCPYGRTKKKVVFFLAKALESTVNLQQSEIDYYIWVSIDEAMRMCHHDNDTKVLNKAEHRLCKKK